MNSNYPHPLIAREGWPFLGIAVVIALALTFAGWWILAVLAWIVALFVLQFFRDPPRTIPGPPRRTIAASQASGPRSRRRRVSQPS